MELRKLADSWGAAKPCPTSQPVRHLFRGRVRSAKYRQGSKIAEA